MALVALAHRLALSLGVLGHVLVLSLAVPVAPGKRNGQALSRVVVSPIGRRRLVVADRSPFSAGAGQARQASEPGAALRPGAVELEQTLRIRNPLLRTEQNLTII
jgi:hypothetical protein